MTYALVLILAMYLLSKMFSKLGVGLDQRVWGMAFLYTLLGSSLRVSVDSGLLPYTYLTVTPGIYFLVFSYWLPIFLISFHLERIKKLSSYHRPAYVFAILPLLVVFYFLGVPEKIQAPMAIISMSLATSMGIYLIFKNLDRADLLIIFGHMLDAYSTFIGMDFLGYGFEQHFLPRKLITASGTAFVMVPVKLIVLLPILYLIKRSSEEEKYLSEMIRVVIFILGFGPGSRDTLRISMGV
mgnify:CR=1 FL=1